MIRQKILLIVMINIFHYSTALGLPSDHKRPLKIRADSVEINSISGINIYRGNVVADQGTSHLTADTITTYQNKNREIVKILARGNGNHLATLDTQLAFNLNSAVGAVARGANALKISGFYPIF